MEAIVALWGSRIGGFLYYNDVAGRVLRPPFVPRGRSCEMPQNEPQKCRRISRKK